MNKKEKIADYLLGMHQMKSSAVVPVGAVVFEENDRKHVEEIFKELGMAVCSIDTSSAEFFQEETARGMANGQTVVWEIGDDISTEARKAISKIDENRFEFFFPGKSEPVVLNPIPKGAKLIILANKDFFDSSDILKFVSSVCRI